MSKILLYNIAGEKLMKIRICALRLGLEAVEVPASDFHQPLVRLLGMETGPVPAEAEEPFSDEMLIMETFSSPLLDAMRSCGATVALKAVVTEQNCRWSGAALCRELRKEHEAMSAYAPKKPVHPHRKKK